MTPLLRSNIPDKFKNKLRSLVTLKFSIAWYVWYLLGGFLTIAVSANWLTSSGCNNRSAKAMMQRHNDYELCLQGLKEYCPDEETANEFASIGKAKYIHRHNTM